MEDELEGISLEGRKENEKTLTMAQVIEVVWGAAEVLSSGHLSEDAD